ncbi:farnesyl cysteine carboxyl-methyltransferase [Marinithermofilum abyssi]|uniref:Farnesyl cysteine carboxyl-methyltransferase n=1 Tax=Marinithermofilum abyssi TaxID=1571185 RepID=A0A8J2VL71_9BACL|nr:farnesyl cysteine carboxyl-methyltransferase [Marinithermofilum abyssi]
MFWLALLPVMFYCLLEILRRRPLDEIREYPESTWFIGVSLFAMTTAPMYTLASSSPDPNWVITGVTTGIAGVALRAWAMITLGRLFSRNIGIQKEHRLIQTGCYRYIRHPGYLGTWMAFTGFALTTGTLWPVLFNSICFLIVYSYRMNVEEIMLTATFGDQYLYYRARTWRLIPYIY